MRGVGARQPSGDLERSVGGALAHLAVARSGREIRQGACELVSARRRPTADRRARAERGPCEHLRRAGQQVQMPRVLALADDRGALRLPHGRPPRDAAAHPANPGQLRQPVAQVPQSIERALGELVIVVLERPCGELETVGDGGQRRALGATQQPDRLRREQRLAEHERHAPADQRIDQPVGARLVRHGHHQDRAGRRLGDHDAASSRQCGRCRRDDGRDRQSGVAGGAAERRDRRLADRDAQEHPDDESHGIEPALAQRRVERDERRDRCEERIVVAADLLGDRPRDRRRDRSRKRPPRGLPERRGPELGRRRHRRSLAPGPAARRSP